MYIHMCLSTLFNSAYFINVNSSGIYQMLVVATFELFLKSKCPGCLRVFSVDINLIQVIHTFKSMNVVMPCVLIG